MARMLRNTAPRGSNTRKGVKSVNLKYTRAGSTARAANHFHRTLAEFLRPVAVCSTECVRVRKRF